MAAKYTVKEREDLLLQVVDYLNKHHNAGIGLVKEIKKGFDPLEVPNFTDPERSNFKIRLDGISSMVYGKREQLRYNLNYPERTILSSQIDSLSRAYDLGCLMLQKNDKRRLDEFEVLVSQGLKDGNTNGTPEKNG